MQKVLNNASVLIWSIFMSIIVLFTFLNINSKVNENLKNNSSSLEKVDTQILIDSFVNEMKNWNFSIPEELPSKYSVEITDNKSYIRWLKLNETEEIRFPSWWLVSIDIINWWPIYYTSADTVSWIIDTSTSNINIPVWSLFMKNLAWHTKYQINSDTEFITKTRWFKVFEIVKWNKRKIRSGEITNF